MQQKSNYYKVFNFFVEAKVVSLEAAVSKDPNALSLLDDKGRSIHTRMLDQVVADALTADGGSKPFDESYEALRWLLDRKAPYLFDATEHSPAHTLVVPQWADSPKAPEVARLMKEYIELGLLDINELVLCEQWQGKGRKTKEVLYPALRASFHLGNHAAARQLLLAGADQAAALATSHHASLAELAASYTMVAGHNKVAAVVTETLMSMRIAQHGLTAPASDSAPRRRTAAV